MFITTVTPAYFMVLEQLYQDSLTSVDWAAGPTTIEYLIGRGTSMHIIPVMGYLGLVAR